MTDNEIIKALECCKRPVGTGGCKDCPLDKDRPCTTTMIENTLDLINRQKAKIKRLEAKCENTQIGYNFARAETEEFKAINKSLKADRPFLIANAKAEAVKEFAERLKSLMLGKYCLYFNAEITELLINKLVKEMGGDE